MSFDYSTLITDRARSDSDTLKTLLSKPMAEWTAEERTAFNGAVMKGSYDYTDLNRVDACLEDLVARLGRVGCNVPGYKRLKIERAVTSSSRLPEGYTEVQYIQSVGAQWINTGFKPNQNTRVALTVDAKPSTAGEWLFGARNGNTDRTFGLLSFNSRYRSDYNNSTDEYSTVTPSGKFEVDKDKNVTKFNGTVGVTAKFGSFQCTYPMFLFANNNAGTAAGFGSFKLYGGKLFDNGNLIRDFVPCIDPTGAVGLYDLVDGKFYGNAGTGSFTAGPVVTWEDKPEEPTETLDPYTWYESDVPTVSLLARYRDNVAAVRAVLRLPEETPEVPATLRRMTQTEANSIEAVLLAVDLILNHIPAAVRHCGVTVCGSKGVRA